MTTVNANELPVRSALVIYDTAADDPIIGEDDDHSIVVSYPRMIQIDTLPGSTSVQIEQRIHPDAEWVPMEDADGAITVTDADGPFLLILDRIPNFVRLVRSAGTGDVKAYAQSA